MSDLLANSPIYEPGDFVALAGQSCLVLADVPADDELVGQWWAAMRAGGGVAQVLELAMRRGLAHLQSLAVVDVAPNWVRIVTRGSAAVAVREGTGRSVVLSSEGRSTWREEMLTGSVEHLLLSLGDSRTLLGLRLPLGAGVVLADSLQLGQPAVFDRSPATVPAATTTTDPPADRTAPAEPTPTTEAAPPTHEMPDDGPGFDHLFGATEHPRRRPEVWEEEEGAPRDHVTQNPQVTSVQVNQGQSDSPVLPSLEAASTPAAPPAQARGLIDALPWEVLPTGSTNKSVLGAEAGSQLAGSSAVKAEVSEPAPNPSVISDSAPEHTVNRSALRAMAAETAGPTVLAAYCPRGHLSAAYAPTCRVCAAPIVPQEAITVNRPVLGVLRLSTGDQVTLDRNVILGRAPSAEAGEQGHRPHVVRLPSPDNDISRSHVEIRLDGWHVLAVDLGSTNGTVVTLPGRAPQRLRAHDPTALEHGTLITLADEVNLTFEIQP